MKKLYLLLFTFHFLFFTLCSAQIISTIVDTNGFQGFSGDGGPAILAEFDGITGVAVNKFGNVYIADDGNSRVRKINTLGIINTYAGNGVPGFSGDGGAATAAEFDFSLGGLGIDDSGNIYIVDDGNRRIRKVNTSGIISTFAGNGYLGYSGDGGPATAAELWEPRDAAADNLGNVYIADPAANVIRKVNSSGIISTFAGMGGGYFGDGGPATAAELNKPGGVAVDNSGNVYIADYDNYRIRKVNTNGIISTIAGSGIFGYSGDGAAATAAELGYVTGVTADDSGNIFIADNAASDRVRKVNSLGIISTFAGSGYNSPGSGGYSGDGGAATAAELGAPWFLGSDTFGNIYIVDEDTGSNRIRKVSVVLNVLANITASVNCYAGTNGNASVVVSEGLPPYTYLWSNGATTSSVSNLTAGTYTVNVTDSLGTKGLTTVIITQPPAISISADSINATNGNCNGSAWAIVIGGTNPYTYLWTGGLTTDTITNQCVNYYCCTITDAHGCIDSTCVNIESVTGFQNTHSPPSIEIYPNPTNSDFSVELSNISGAYNFELYNILGEKISFIQLKTATTQINMSSDAKGIYLYRVLKEDGELVGEGKVVIEH